MSIVLLITLSAIVIVVPSVSTASSGVPPLYNQIGYNGNSSIYMSTDVPGSTYPTFLTAFNSSSGATTKYCGYCVQNSIGIGIAPNDKVAKKLEYNFSECSVAGPTIFVHIPISVSGLEYIFNSFSDPQGNPTTTPKLCYSFSGFPGVRSTFIEYLQKDSSGLNVTNESSTLTANDPSISSIVLLAGGVAISAASEAITLGSDTPAVISGWVTTLNTLSAADSFISAYSSCLTTTNIGGGTTYCAGKDKSPNYIIAPATNGVVVNYQCPNSGNTVDTYYNAYSAQYVLSACIPSTCFSDTAKLCLNASNLLSQNQCFAKGLTFGASSAITNLAIPIVPAYTIGGNVCEDGKVLSGQNVKICDKTNNTAYVVTTGSTGNYRFFAKPDCNYLVSLCSYPDYSHCLSASSTNNEGGNTSVNLIVPPYTAQFTESGLPPGTEWSVDLAGDTQSTTSSSIVFDVPNGSYSYSVDSSGYTASPSSGTIQVDSSSVT